MSSSGRLQPRRVGEQAAAGIGVRRLVGMAEVPLGVVRVVEAPVGERCSRDRGVEHVGAPEHRERGEVATERPPTDGDPVEVELGPVGGDRPERVDLVLEDRRGEIVVDGPLPLAPETRRAAAVDDDDGEALVGQPLGRQNELCERTTRWWWGPAVRVEQYREALPCLSPGGQEERRRQPPLAARAPT